MKDIFGNKLPYTKTQIKNIFNEIANKTATKDYDVFTCNELNNIDYRLTEVYKYILASDGYADYIDLNDLYKGYIDYSDQETVNKVNQHRVIMLLMTSEIIRTGGL